MTGMISMAMSSYTAVSLAGRQWGNAAGAGTRPAMATAVAESSAARDAAVAGTADAAAGFMAGTHPASLDFQPDLPDGLAGRPAHPPLPDQPLASQIWSGTLPQHPCLLLRWRHHPLCGHAGTDSPARTTSAAPLPRTGGVETGTAGIPDMVGGSGCDNRTTRLPHARFDRQE